MHFYTKNTGNNIHLLRFNKYQHIFIGSKHSDRLSKATKYKRVYDAVWIASTQQALACQREGITDINFKYVGKPYLLRYLEVSPLSLPRDKSTSLEILYAPSVGSLESISSLHLAHSILNISQSNISIIAPSSYSRGNSKQRKILNELELLRLDTPTSCSVLAENTRRYHLAICDTRSLSLEILARRVPILIYLPRGHQLPEEITEYFQACKYSTFFSSGTELVELIDNLRANGDDLSDRRALAAEHLIGVNCTLSGAFEIQLNKILEESF